MRVQLPYLSLHAPVARLHKHALRMPQVHGQADMQAAVRSLDAAAAKAAAEALAKVAGSKDGLAVLGRAQAAGASADALRLGQAAAAAAQPQVAAPRAPAPAPPRPAQPPAPPLAGAAAAGPEALLAVSERKDERARRCGDPPVPAELGAGATAAPPGCTCEKGASTGQ